MTSVAKCVYKDGVLKQPSIHDMTRARTHERNVGYATNPTTRPGFIHVRKISISDPDVAVARGRALGALTEFYDTVGRLPGFSTLSVESSEGFIPINSNTAIDYMITYVIRDTRPQRG